MAKDNYQLVVKEAVPDALGFGNGKVGRVADKGRNAVAEAVAVENGIVGSYAQAGHDDEEAHPGGLLAAHVAECAKVAQTAGLTHYHFVDKQRNRKYQHCYGPGDDEGAAAVGRAYPGETPYVTRAYAHAKTGQQESHSAAPLLL